MVLGRSVGFFFHDNNMFRDRAVFVSFLFSFFCVLCIVAGCFSVCLGRRRQRLSQYVIAHTQDGAVSDTTPTWAYSFLSSSFRISLPAADGGVHFSCACARMSGWRLYFSFFFPLGQQALGSCLTFPHPIQSHPIQREAARGGTIQKKRQYKKQTGQIRDFDSPLRAHLSPSAARLFSSGN